jgi:hypothetical protein
MKYRPMQVADLPMIGRLYHQMLVESYQTSEIHYPRWDATTPTQMIAFLYHQLTQPPVPQCPHCRGDLPPREGEFFAWVAVLGNRPKGMAFGEVYARQIGMPRLIAHCSLIYVEPKSRAGRGTKAVAPNLIKRMLTEATGRFPDAVIEGSYVPGTHGSRLWPRLGLQPYVTYCAYVDERGAPKPAASLFAHRGGKEKTYGQHLRRAGGAEK